MELTIHSQVLLGGFLIALAFGALVAKTEFCTLGAVSDWINIGDTRRLRAWFLAIAVAMLGVVLLEAGGAADLGQTRPPYRTPQFAWLRYLLGGLMFGVGMTLASGCTSKTVVRLGGGNGKSAVVLAMVALGAWLLTQSQLALLVFDTWLPPFTLDLGRLGLVGQDLGSLLSWLPGFDDPVALRLALAVVLGGLLLAAVLSGHRDRDTMLGGVGVGLCVVGGWWLTAGSLGREWIEEAQWLDIIPRGVASQSYTFVNPLSETVLYMSAGGEYTLLTFGVVAVFGALLGAFAYSLATGRLRLEWFRSWADFWRHVAGGLLMGLGGVLAMGCTVGQGITGTSTLALGSFMALGAIILGSAATMKVEYYKLLYEDASLWDALLSSGVDLRLLPRSLRRLESL